LSVLRSDNRPRVRDGYTRLSTRGHARSRTDIHKTSELQAHRARECVRRGSTVRVRQRALQKPRKSRLSPSAELARAPVCGEYGAVYGAFSSEMASGKRQNRPGSPGSCSVARARSGDHSPGLQKL
jgi:hypothetical protein